ncbi:MAG: DEAD/DEAH box helicase [Sandaracinaceae bacterium]
MPTDPPPPGFASLGLSELSVRSTEAAGFERPTEVQSAVIPAVLEGRDVFASAPTGSGKTAAYLLPLLAPFEAPRAPRARGERRPVAVLVVVPTRELAAQVGESFRAFGATLPAPPHVEVVVGGRSVNAQMLALRGGADVLVATPGRLLDLVRKNAVALDAVRTLVLDEADRLLAHGFRAELDAILAEVPTGRQTLLLSATLPAKVRALAKQVLNAPSQVDFGEKAAAPVTIEQRAIEVDRPRRTQLLRHLLDSTGAAQVLVFVATTHSTRHVAQKLRGLGFEAAPLNGKLSQGARDSALDRLKSGSLRVLVATDLAARGVHIDGLDLVVNYDLPRSTADYLHRIGRTGRAGAAGAAVSFLTAETRAHFRLIEKRHDLAIEREQVPGFEPVEPEVTTVETQGVGGVKGRRKSKKDRLREAAAKKQG